MYIIITCADGPRQGKGHAIANSPITAETTARRVCRDELCILPRSEKYACRGRQGALARGAGGDGSLVAWTSCPCVARASCPCSERRFPGPLAALRRGPRNAIHRASGGPPRARLDPKPRYIAVRRPRPCHHNATGSGRRGEARAGRRGAWPCMGGFGRTQRCTAGQYGTGCMAQVFVTAHVNLQRPTLVRGASAAARISRVPTGDGGYPLIAPAR